jgi:lipoprotein-anchoring transpeptidase ErfK/SrfK
MFALRRSLTAIAISLAGLLHGQTAALPTPTFHPGLSVAELPASPLDRKPTDDDAVRLQIFLDESNFGPGVIDGKPGLFTELAVQSWNEVNGYPHDDWTAVNTAARQAVPHAFAVAVVPEAVTKWVDTTLPYKRSLQAERKRMSYRSVGEFMAERYHCDVPFLVALNGASTIDRLAAKASILVPNVKPFLIENLTGRQYRGAADPAQKSEPTTATGAEPAAAAPPPTAEEIAAQERVATYSARHVVVDTKSNQMRIFEAAPVALIVAEPGTEAAVAAPRANRALVASFPITPGKPQFIRYGTWELRNMVELPYWRYDQQLLDTGKRGPNALNIPPGPNSPVGIIWNGLSRPGIGLHGTSDPETIGRTRSSGCIRLANWDAIRLPTLIRPGATVEIR